MAMLLAVYAFRAIQLCFYVLGVIVFITYLRRR